MTIPEIAHLLRTQDNHITANPIFMVQVKVSERGDPDNGDPYYWLNRDSERVDYLTAARLDDAESVYLDRFVDDDDQIRMVKDYRKVYYLDVYHHHMPFFTHQGALDYIKINGHNLREPRVYVESGYRNHEWEAVRAHLMGIT